MLHLAQPTRPGWAAYAVAHLHEILLDHAHCEKKAASTAVGLMFRYEERPELQTPLSQLAREGRLAVVDSLVLDAPKTKLLADKIKAMGMGLNGASVLVITDNLDENLYLASRNLPHVLVVEPRYADPVSLVHFTNVLITRPALAKVQEMLG